MAIPDYETLMLPVLRLTGEGVARIPDVIPQLATEFGLTDEELSEVLPSGRTSVIASRAHWARTYMSKAGLVRPVKRGVFEITPEGRALLATEPSRIDKATLSRNPQFVEWKRRSAEKRPVTTARPTKELSQSSVAVTTPEEEIERAFSEIDAELAEEVLARVFDSSPAFFERLIVDLLVAMGYGRGQDGAGRRIGRSGDGGIDGIINEDALGLDAVYIQAKRYQPESKIGRPAIQQFVGSLTGEGATKGVFVMTSDFSTEARDYVRRVQQRIVLINGTELARLLIAHEIGVRARKTYVLRSVDEDYFIDT